MKKLSFFTFLLVTFFSFSQEICNNAIDDDGDGLIDLNDPDCACSNSGIQPLPASYVLNESFEMNDCCPSDYGQMSCATNWGQATAAAADFLNTCGFVGPFVNTNLFPFPTGQGASSITITSDYKEYIGTCLGTPLVAGTTYTLKFFVGMTMITADGSTNCSTNFANYADSIDMVLYGATVCGNLPLNTFDCPTAVSPSFVLLGSSNISVDTNGYQFVSITFTPTSAIQEIMLGTDCIMPSPWPSSMDVINADCAPYFVIDNLVLNETASFESITLSSNGSHCTNDLVLTAAHSNLTGGAGQWYLDGVALLSETGDNLSISTNNYGGGLYTYLYQTATDCFQDTLTVEEPDNLLIQGMDTSICLGNTATIHISGNATNYTWTSHSSILSISNEDAIVQPTTTTTYQTEGQSAHGCTQTVTSTVTVVPVPTGVSITVSPEEVSDLATFSAAPSTYDYTWTLPDGSTIDSAAALYNFMSIGGVYTILLDARNSTGCSTSYSYEVEIRLIDDKVYYIPNAFSPDGNEFNAVFKPVLSPKMDVYDYHFWVFDRKGNIIFESLDPQVGWDGTFKNRVLASDIYTWKLVVGFKNDAETIDERGHVFLAR